ncbi:MAG: N-acetylmuramoyl-L-alanine amidase [Roseiflexaceae bacterium]|nr:N-acetylmuramoyl-L-alanine amidase [Roseiflexaceae bacterium]
MPPFINRRLSIAEWLDYVANYDFGPLPPSRVVLHHTYIPNLQQWQGSASMKGMQTFYGRKGWTSAPHLYVGDDGIWLATPLREIGIHAGTGNSGRTNGQLWYSIGLEMIGYYDKVRPSGGVWEASKAVLGGLSKRLGIAPRQLISFHRDYTNQKSCPGWAVTKEWVWAETEAWMNNQQRPPEPEPPVQFGSPTPEVEELIELLMEESYKRRGEGYNSDWAFHQHAVQNGLGFPIGKSARIDLDGKGYAYQAFAQDTLYNEIPHWGDVQRLSAILQGSVPTGGLSRALLDATYKSVGATFHPEWAFHQYAMTTRLGPPLGESAKIKLGTADYAFQVYALDTLYNKVPNWGDIHRLSELAGTADRALAQLRDALLAETYKRGAGAAYHADWAFHQLARAWNLGAPLSDSYRVTSGATQYAIQIFATDTLYNLIPNWKDVMRVSSLTGGGAAVLGVEMPEEPIVLSADTQFEPAPAPYHIFSYRAPFAAPTAYTSRSGSRVRMIVLHGDDSPSDTALALMTTPGAKDMTHYYITSDGLIYRLIGDEKAALHAGMAEWAGRHQNINRISLGVTAQRGPDGYTPETLHALNWLVATLRARYGIAANAVVAWGTLDDTADGTDVPWNATSAQVLVEA